MLTPIKWFESSENFWSCVHHQVRIKTSLMTQYCTRFKAAEEVPDPYYGGAAGFETVLDLLEDASQGLLQHIQQDEAQK